MAKECAVAKDFLTKSLNIIDINSAISSVEIKIKNKKEVYHGYF